MSKPAPLRIPEIEDEPHIEYLLRDAAAFILAHAKEAEAWHDDYGDVVTGEEAALSLSGMAEDMAKDRAELGRGMRLFGTLIQAGNDEETGKPSITITTSLEELKGQKHIPFYRLCEITFKPL